MRISCLCISALLLTSSLHAEPKINIFTFSEIKASSIDSASISEGETKIINYSIEDWLLINKYLPQEEYNSYLPDKRSCSISLEISFKAGVINPGRAHMNCMSGSYTGTFDVFIGDRSLNTLFTCSEFNQDTCSVISAKKGSKGTINVMDSFDLFYRKK